MEIPALRIERAGGRVLLDTDPLVLEPGETHAITGPSGAGKTLFAKALFGWAVEGARGVLRPGEGAALMIQDPSGGLTPTLSIGAHFREVLRGRDWRRRALGLCEELNLEMPDLLERRPGSFSGGEKQRLMLALVLAREPSVLVCDEPAASLERESETRLWELLRKIANKRPLTLIFITHRLDLIEARADEVSLMVDGRFVYRGSTAGFFTRAEHPVHERLLDYRQTLASASASDRPRTGKPLVKIEGLALRFGRQTVFEGFDWTIGKGEWWWLIGPSGSGKTSLARFICGLCPEGEGTLSLEDEQLSTRLRERSIEVRRRIQYLFQHGGLTLNPALDVASQLTRAHGNRRWHAFLGELGLDRLDLDRKPASFSMGERQRLNLILSLATDPDLLICDELFSSCDIATRVDLARFLQRRQREGLTVIAITHDRSLTRSVQGETLALNKRVS